ncbi:hydroxymethylbilane synthase [Bengtsoniella intestinalis]|uniref:hydroxymethylbilane synthase n=1 Tax=Bengtsoniella intestinalis TaxID=3073143 RepID=UPI00391F67CD
MSRTIRVGSRDSILAVIQSKMVMAAIGNAHPDLQLELVTMKTTGDKILDKTLDKIGGKGLFVKELDEALLENQVDITVHSGKDLPMEVDARLPLLAFSHRADPRDVLVLPQGVTTLDPTLPIGCSSQRRTIYLKKLYPNMNVASVRGNVQTRLRKLDEGQYSALVLAGAGLERLGLQERISRYFTPEEMLPAACQGILAIQGRAGEDCRYLDCFASDDGRDCALSERAFTRRLDGGCSSPVAAFSTVEGDTITLTGLYVDSDLRTAQKTVTGKRTDGEALAIALADQLKEELS